MVVVAVMAGRGLVTAQLMLAEGAADMVRDLAVLVAALMVHLGKEMEFQLQQILAVEVAELTTSTLRQAALAALALLYLSTSISRI
tara:strand:+ start:75 stop:332 length:258 start_codon:yes stop_codon:yes gene_type:complete